MQDGGAACFGFKERDELRWQRDRRNREVRDEEFQTLYEREQQAKVRLQEERRRDEEAAESRRARASTLGLRKRASDGRFERQCPACAEWILGQALKCRFCQTVVDRVGFE